MSRGIACSVDNPEGRIDELVVIQIKAPHDGGSQNEEKYDQMSSCIVTDCEFLAGLGLAQAKEGNKTKYPKSGHRQKGEATL